MAGNHANQDLHVAKFEPSQRLKTLSYSFIGIGVLAFIIGLMRDPQRLWTSYLAAFFFFSCLGLGGMFFAAINHVTKAGWSVSVRRYAEGMTAFLPIMLVGSLVLALGMTSLYPWANPEVANANPYIAAKLGFLNIPFMILRLVLFGVGCLIFKKLLVGSSLLQDKTGDPAITVKSVGRSIAFILFFAIMFSLFTVDLLMSLLPTWYSTIFGIYCFAGLFQSSLAVLALIIIYMKKNGYVRGYVTTEHLHDVVKFLKGFTVFWAYIAFSQFMLIWYANIPEETEYYIMRAQHGWLGISMALLVLRFIVPFIALLPRGAKRNETHVILVSILILVMQYVDIYWMIYPNFNDGGVAFGLLEICMFLGFLGLFLTSLMNFFSKNQLVATKDPRMDEALNHHVTY